MLMSGIARAGVAVSSACAGSLQVLLSVSASAGVAVW